MAEFTFNCPLCSMPMTAGESQRGHSTMCLNCNENVTVPEFTIEPGMQIGGYVMERMLGVGGMGEVWLAHQTAMSRKVALKILNPSLTKNKEFVDQFIREVKMTGRLEHPNVITAFDAGMDAGLYYLAISFVDGEELEQKLDRERLIPETEALKMVLSVAKALNYSWKEANILHRDVKPANIMIDKSGVVKLMDMGISKSVSEGNSITQSGTIVGTPHYISPEQAQADPNLDFRSDIYSLGASLFHMVTGTVPFDADNPMGVLTKHITERLIDPRKVNPEISEPCSALIKIMMRKDRTRRQQSWDEVEKDIRLAIKGNMPVLAKDSNLTKTMKRSRSGKSYAASRGNLQVQKTSRAPMIITTFLILAGAGAGTFYWLQHESEERARKAAILEAKNEEIRLKNERMAKERAEREALAAKLKEAWEKVAPAIRKLETSEQFAAAIAALEDVIAIETSPKKIDYAQKLMDSVQKRKVERVTAVMNDLNGQAARIASQNESPSEAFALISAVYSDYTGVLRDETQLAREAMLEKYSEKLETVSDVAPDKSAAKQAINEACAALLSGDFEAVEEVGRPRFALDFAQSLQNIDSLIVKGLSKSSGMAFKIDDVVYTLESVSGNSMKVRYDAVMGGRKITSKKSLSVDLLPLSARYKSVLAENADVANLYVAIELLKKGSSDKAGNYLEKIEDTKIKTRLIRTLSEL